MEVLFIQPPITVYQFTRAYSVGHLDLHILLLQDSYGRYGGIILMTRAHLLLHFQYLQVPIYPLHIEPLQISRVVVHVQVIINHAKMIVQPA